LGPIDATRIDWRRRSFAAGVLVGIKDRARHAAALRFLATGTELLT